VKFLLPASVFVAVFFNHYLMHEFPSLPNRFQYLSDLIIVAVGAVVILRVTLLRRVRLIPIGYWLAFLAFTYVVVASAIVNHVSPEITFAGIRFYFKYVPLFLIPIAYDYDARDVKRLWIMLIGLSLLQLPAAFHQRFIEYSGDLSGDKIAGTLGLSTSLSLFLVAMITVAAALYIDKKISLKLVVPLCLLFLLPASINETKITPIALGVGAAALLFVRRSVLDWRQMMVVGVVGCVLLGAFVVVYDRLYKAPAGSQGFLDFISDPAHVVDGYSLRGVEAKADVLARENPDLVARPFKLTEQNSWIGRVDSLKMPIKVLANSGGIRFFFGLGIGSISSRFGDGGQYTYLADQLNATNTSMTQLMWETGLLGSLLCVFLMSLIVRDSLVLSRSNDGWQTLGTAWFGVSVSVFFLQFYTNFIPLGELTCLFAFFSGLVCRAKRNAVRKSLPPITTTFSVAPLPVRKVQTTTSTAAR
jgi:hypothetical protein